MSKTDDLYKVKQDIHPNEVYTVIYNCGADKVSLDSVLALAA